MSLSLFLKALVETGRVQVGLDVKEAPDAEADAVLLEMDRVSRLSLAGTAPEYLPAVALWAAGWLYRGCQFLVCRDIAAEVISQTLQEPCPAPHAPATEYSADLTLQYLPELIVMTRQVAAGDALLQELLAGARAWPLSSVGVPDVGPVATQNFLADPTLRQLYLDRIFARNDLARLDDPQVARSAREALGAYPELCPAAANHLNLNQASQRT